MDVESLLTSNLEQMSLNILVFGPAVEHLSKDERMRNLQLKRIQIREELEKLGHWVKYAEELVDPDLPGSGSNAVFQELIIMKEQDLIITLVESPGSIVEASVISIKPDLASKSSFFMDESFREGLASSACQLATEFGAKFQLYKYPEDLVDCHLLGHVKSHVQSMQVKKFLT